MEAAGWALAWTRGSFLKMVTDSEMMSSDFYTEERLEAIFRLSKELPPELCAELVVRCENRAR